MSYAEEWKKCKEKYEREAKEKKPSEKWFGNIRKSTGLESACKDLDSAIAKANRPASEKALTSLKKAGEAYLQLLDKTIAAEPNMAKQFKTQSLRNGLDAIVRDAHNEIKGLDQGQFDAVMGPDIMSRFNGLKFHGDAFVKSFATNAQFQQSYTTKAVSPLLVKNQTDFATAFQICLVNHQKFASHKGKTMKKSTALLVGRTCLKNIMDNIGHDGMMGALRTWEYNQAADTKGNNDELGRFKKSTSYQILQKIGATLGEDEQKLNAAIAKVEKIVL
ncbi:MAG: hypothetical protein JST16_05670 [Bdellovibrionales bacterium]|nr:hypothetical protein [Bdellovibrionales bacterium]